MRIRIAVVAALVLLLASVASARDIPAAGFTIDEVVTWLQSSGHPTQVIPDSGVGHIQTSTGGVPFRVYMFDCKEGRCGSIQFAAGLEIHGKFDLSRMNEWNTKNRWGRGYYDGNNVPWVEMDVDMTPGGTYELLNDELATWNKTLVHFVTMFGA